MSQTSEAWFPLFEFTSFLYRSYLLMPSEADPSGDIEMKEWARGDFVCGQAFAAAEDGYTLGGRLVAPGGASFEVKAQGRLGQGDLPGSFEATVEGAGGLIQGVTYRLDGLVHPMRSVNAGAARVASIRGSVKAVSGLRGKPDMEPGGAPVGTVGAFVIVALGPAG
jgi:hypothetical protein